MPKYDLTTVELEKLADFILALDFKKYPAKTVTRKDVAQGNYLKFNNKLR
jgi:hypothetical protein